MVNISKLLVFLSFITLFSSGIVTQVPAFAVTYGAPITIVNPTPAVSDFFGNSVSISGDKILIGAVNDDTGATDSGSAYLFDATTGALLQTFSNPTPTVSGNFGYSVSISGDKVLVGAFGDNTGSVFQSGVAYLFLPIPDVIPLPSNLCSLHPELPSCQNPHVIESDPCFKNGQLICKIHFDVFRGIVPCYDQIDGPMCHLPKTITQETLLKIKQEFPPLKQVEAGIHLKDIVAAKGNVLIMNDHRSSPA